ncbi:MAG TPA: hypothetical protein VHE09_11375 [Rhizomicrobium sp.]|jgi:hypothetical protein|nr:hypothetical protein [Rhizomicrobium sp.]
MTVRTSRKTVTFSRPFVLQGFAHVLPPGDYVIDTEEERLDTSLTLAWRRISTVMRVRVDGAVECRAVEPDELAEALLRDGANNAPGSPASRVSAKFRHNSARRSFAYPVRRTPGK